MTKLAPKKTLRSLQFYKFWSRDLAIKLASYNRGQPLEKAYRNTVYCVETFLSKEGKLHATYCKNRWCMVCGRIRTGRLINLYQEDVTSLPSPHFLTLTLPTCLGKELPAQIIRMEKAWRQIYKQSKRSKSKSEGINLKGIRKAECTIRPNGFYHYHFHLIVADEKQGRWIITEWLRRFPEAVADAQDIRRADKTSLKELFKYATKLSINVNSKRKSFKRLNVVFEALRGKRTYQTFGGIKHRNEYDFSGLNLSSENYLDNDIFKWLENDWFSMMTGLPLVDKPISKPAKSLKKQLEKV